MPTPTIKLKPDQDFTLRRIHLESRMPIDQAAQRPVAFSHLIVEPFNADAECSYSADEIRHYIITKRKAGKWFRFGTEYDPLRCPGEDVFAAHEWVALRQAYVEIDRGRDQFAADESLRDLMADKFFAMVGRYVSGDLLHAACMAAQKDSRHTNWPKIGKGAGDIGFGDINEVG